MIKKILFDIDNTLLDFKLCAEASMRQAFKDWNLEYKPEYFDVFMKINDHYWRRLEDKEITRDQLYKMRFVDVFKELDIDCDGVLFEKDFVKHLYNSHNKIEGADEILEYLDPKYELYITSNSSYEEQSGRLRASNLLHHFKELYTSEELGHAKPSKEYFDIVFEELGNPDKDEVMIIGDSPHADILGGKEYGIKTCWFNYTNMPEDEVESDYTIHNLSELKDIL